ncbi:MAG: hypothetical protein V7L14_00270 [Nostoc sp.]|uniref:hypothetical protein n=1 Tax=Nostoc sp. TaxID=1180 RepID=UPI002FF7279A
MVQLRLKLFVKVNFFNVDGALATLGESPGGLAAGWLPPSLRDATACFFAGVGEADAPEGRKEKEEMLN